MRFISCLLLSLSVSCACGQELNYARKMIDTLTSATFWGRGYTKDGMKKAADFLVKEFEFLGLEPLDGKSFLQNYEYSVNTFPGKIELEVNGKDLVPGKDFIVSPESRGIKAKGKLIQKDSSNFVNPKNTIVVSMKDKLTWSVSRQVANYTAIEIKKQSLKDNPSTIRINLENSFIPNFKASNVSGMIKGTIKPDSLILITAHYDHLGGMGDKTYFPGANDNASGTSMLLSLAKYYINNPPAYSIAFICFSGEEAGLVGSKYFVEHPPISLDKVRFLVNLDLTGTGNEGITVVNATEYQQEFNFLKDINEKKHYLVKINPRGKAANSDHYWFSLKNIPSFFIYTMGGIKAYHDIYDVSGTLPLSSFENLFKLITDFNRKLMCPKNN